ncbi:MAG: energy transducer TonB [Smithellaceae bacterium]|nr:energy transducer TonB [Smithellaceae bacterium]
MTQEGWGYLPDEKPSSPVAENRAKALVLSVVFHLALALLVVYASSGFGPLLALGGKANTLTVSWVTLPTGAARSGKAVHDEGKVEEVALAEAASEDSASEPRVVEAVPAENGSSAATTAVAIAGDGTAAKSGFTQAGGAIQRVSLGPASTGGSGISLVSPRLYSGGHPYYPEIARLRGYEGTVLVAAQVNADGRVLQLFVRKTSGYAVLDRSALESVRSWRFDPGRLMGRPAAMWVDVPVRFLLRERGNVS